MLTPEVKNISCRSRSTSRTSRYKSNTIVLGIGLVASAVSKDCPCADDDSLGQYERVFDGQGDQEKGWEL